MPRPTTLTRTLDEATSSVASTATATATGSITRRVSDLPIHLGTPLPTTAGLRSVLEPASTLTSAVAHAAPTVPSLLAPVVAVPRTLLQPSGVIGRTGGLLVGTVTGLTDTTTSLTGTVGALGRTAVGLPRGALGGPVAPTGAIGTAGAGARTASPTLALAPGTDATRFPMTASTSAPPELLRGQERDPVPGDVGAAPREGSGSPDAPWFTADAAAGPVSRHGLPGAPAPWDPVAPAAPAGTAGASAGSSVSVLTGVLTDPLAIPAILAGLVLVACGRRCAWWFPEVAIGPD